MNLTDYVTSLIRTWVPIGIGLAITWLSTKVGFVIDEQTKEQGIAFFIATAIGLYYSLIRWLETKVPQFGWLLGVAKMPGYAPINEAPPAGPANEANPARGPPR